MPDYRRRFRRGVRAALVVLVACLGLGANVASAKPKAVAHCITPTGVDLNERYGISETIVAAPFCTEVDSGRYWTVSNGWFMNLTFDTVPVGFVPEGATPLEDFIAKFIGVKYVIDPGTQHQRIYVFPNDDDLGVVTDPGQSVVNPATLGTLKPLSVGDHVVDSYFLMRAMHCDGFGDVVADNCLPAGETLFTTAPFTVIPGHN
jgi:hypothetical protein